MGMARFFNVPRGLAVHCLYIYTRSENRSIREEAECLTMW
jgi:hypothetical protein